MIHQTIHLLLLSNLASSFTFIPSPSSTCHLTNINNEMPNNEIKYIPHNKRISTITKARTAPTSLFDLEDIEAFEESLEHDTEIIEDDDDDENDYDDDDTNNEIIVEIDESYHNKRLDSILQSMLTTQNDNEKISRSACGKLIADSNVLLLQEDSHYKPITQKSFKVQKNMIFKILQPKQEAITEIIQENIPLHVLYEDEYMIVINKPANMVVHPSVGNWNGTLVNALAYYLSNDSPFEHNEDFVNVIQDGIEEEQSEKKNLLYYRPGIVHRLDKGTTGVIIIAKTKQVLSILSKSFANRQVKKTYLAITVGNPGSKIKIDKRIKRHPMHRQRMMVVSDSVLKNYAQQQEGNTVASVGRTALSYVDTLGSNGQLSVVYVRIQTGRTHQIRVHLQDRHTPIYGDDVYGIASWNRKLSKELKSKKFDGCDVYTDSTRPLLHAHKLEINHPVTGESMVFTAPMPQDMSIIATTIWPTGKTEYPQFFTTTSEP